MVHCELAACESSHRQVATLSSRHLATTAPSAQNCHGNERATGCDVATDNADEPGTPMQAILRHLTAIYRANPLRPHCRPGRHVALCRLVAPHMTQPFCGPID